MKKLFLIILLCAIATPFFGYKWVEDYFYSAGISAEETIIIQRGSGLNKISNQLATEGIIKYPQVFRLYIKFFKDDKSLKAGEYAFPANASPNNVYNIVKSGKVVMHKITFPEGITVYEAEQILLAEDKLTGGISESPEGILLPDTYTFILGEERIKIIGQMQHAMTKFLDAEWEKRDKSIPLKTKEEALILASIVEKETGLASERGRIAAVFTNRLRKKMRLQSDPTTIYGITLGKGKLERKLLYKDLRKKTAYNTYAIKRLPPTPIANPSREAIIAVLNPPQTNELYFVADGTGGHTFAKTMKEHERNVQRWRKIQRKNK